MNISIYPRSKNKNYEQNFIFKNFEYYIKDNNIDCILHKRNSIDKINDFVITVGIAKHRKSMLLKYKEFNINGINIDSSSYNHLKFTTISGVRPPHGKYLGFTDSLLNDYNKKYIFENKIKKFRTEGNHILVCLDFLQDISIWNSSTDLNIDEIFNIIKNTIIKIKENTKKKIIVRFHPRETKRKEINNLSKELNFKISSQTMKKDLNNCWFGVCFNSAAVCLEFVLAGIPINTLPSNMGKDISIDITKIDEININTYDRELFLNKVSYSLWHYGNSYYLAHHLFKNVFPVIFKSNEKIMKILKNRENFKLYTEKYLDKLQNRNTFYQAIFNKK